MEKAEARPRLPALLGGLTTGLYVILYLYAIDDLSLADRADFTVILGSVPLERALEARGRFLFEALGLIQLGTVVLLLSPLNLAIGALLGGLLGANVHGIASLQSGGRACAMPRGGQAGALSGSLPALLAGGACCAPTLLLIGVPGIAAVAGLLPWLLPLSLLLLIVSRFWLRRQGAPPLLRRHSPNLA